MVWITTTEAAAHCGKWSAQQIGYAAAMGLIRRKVRTGRTLVNKEDVAALAAYKIREAGTGGRA